MSSLTPIADEIYHRGYYVGDDFLNQNTYHALCSTIQAMHQEGFFQAAKIGSKQNKTLEATVRNDHIVWLDNTSKNPAILAYFEALNHICLELNQSLFLGLIEYEAHFAIYPPNHFYKKHVDQFANTNDRRISCVFYLNDDWHQAYGGELILYDEHDKPCTSILPTGNRMVCFNSNIAHEVKTTHKMRYSIAAWLKIRPCD